MKAILKNFIVGFGISSVGSFPLGYINIFAASIFSKYGIQFTMFFLLGVVLVESLVVFATLYLVNKFLKNTLFYKFTEVFSILFLLILAAILMFTSVSLNTTSQALNLTPFSAFVLGFTINVLNFIQVPFWTGWNSLLLQQKIIKKSKSLYFVIGTSTGTVVGILAFVYLFDTLINLSNGYQSVIVNILFPVVFILLAFYQFIKYYKKYNLSWFGVN